jgi:starch synthase
MPAKLALVHHANQFLITNGYDDRQGIDEIAQGYAAVLGLHEDHGVVVNLHLSGTLIEAAAWHCPWFLEIVKDLRAKGVVELIGGVYAETVMTLFDLDFNIAQLNELLFLYRKHLDCPPQDVRVSWVPERVWATEKMAQAFTSEQLINGGYEAVLLDDRLLFPSRGSYSGSPRSAFDALGPFEHGSSDGIGVVPESADVPHQAEAHTVYEIAGSTRLMALPISADVRHWIPPTRLEHWSRLEDVAQIHTGDDADQCLLIYADDLERTAGVGGWEDPLIEAYDAFLRWVSEREDVAAVPLSSQLETRAARKPRPIEAGTFFELAYVWGAGEDYGRWAHGPAWAPYRQYLDAALADVAAAEEAGADKRLLELSRKHLFASTYETAWHDPGESGRSPAGWAKAVASHARSAHVMTAAARWFAKGDRGWDARVTDLDRDGDDELVIANADLFAVMSPSSGGRLLYLFARGEDGGALMIGNPADDWHTQEDLNRYMVAPPNHPGALSDVGFERDSYRISRLGSEARWARTEMTNVEPGSRLFGTRKTVLVSETSPVLSVCYRLPPDAGDQSIKSCLSPDYSGLLREGRCGLMPYDGAWWRGFRLDDAAVWMALAPDERTEWATPSKHDVGHGMNVRLLSKDRHFHLLIGCGPVEDEALRSFGLLKESEEGED